MEPRAWWGAGTGRNVGDSLHVAVSWGTTMDAGTPEAGEMVRLVVGTWAGVSLPAMGGGSAGPQASLAPGEALAIFLPSWAGPVWWSNPRRGAGPGVF